MKDLPDAVETEVPLNVFGELERVTRLARVSEYEMLAEHLLLVLVALHLDDGARGVRVGRNDGKALAGDSERTLHDDGGSASLKRKRVSVGRGLDRSSA